MMHVMTRFIRCFLLTAAVFSFISCGEEQTEDKGTTIYELDNVKETSVSLLNETGYKLNTIITGKGFTLDLTFGTEDYVIPDGKYEVGNSVNSIGECSVALDDGRGSLPVKSGTVSVSSTADSYSMDIELSSIYDYHFTFKGQMKFSLEFTPSGNTFFLSELGVIRYNQWWQPETVSGVTNYAVTILDPSGNSLAYFEFISDSGKTLSEICGSYDVKASATSVGTIPAGSVSWGSGTGSYYLDETGNIQYITSGKIVLSSVKGIDGLEYYSFTGSGLLTTSLSGLKSNNASISLKYVTNKPLLGKVERDHVITSKYKNREMKYSVYLPDSYDGVKEFPVLWLLHGYGDDQNSWLDKGYLHRIAHDYFAEGGREMIIVTPDGLTDFYMGAYEQYFFEELMPEVETKFKVKKGREYRTVAGLSMGGHGSLYYGLYYNDKFCYAYAMSPACKFNIQQVIAGKDKADLPGITIETGIQDQTTNLQSVENIHNTLLNEGVTHDYITRDGGHDWTFWQTSLPKVLKKSGEVFGE